MSQLPNTLLLVLDEHDEYYKLIAEACKSTIVPHAQNVSYDALTIFNVANYGPWGLLLHRLALDGLDRACRSIPIRGFICNSYALNPPHKLCLKFPADSIDSIIEILAGTILWLYASEYTIRRVQQPSQSQVDALINRAVGAINTIRFEVQRELAL